MQQLFRIRELVGDGQAGASFFWIESSAPLQVEGDPPASLGRFEAALKELPDESAITDVATRIAAQENPHVVIRIHGFNNPLGIVLNRYAEALNFVRKNEPEIANDTNLFCMGYRWTSEHAPLLGGAKNLRTMPPLLRLFFGIWAIVAVLGLVILLSGLRNPAAWHRPGLVIGGL